MTLSRTYRPLSLVLSLFIVAATLGVVASVATPAQAAVTAGSSSSGTGTGTSLVLAKPSGTSAGQLLLAQVSTQARERDDHRAARLDTGRPRPVRTANLKQAVFRKLATGPSEPASYSLTFVPVGFVGGRDHRRTTGSILATPVEAFSGDTATRTRRAPRRHGQRRVTAGRAFGLRDAGSNTIAYPPA